MNKRWRSCLSLLLTFLMAVSPLCGAYASSVSFVEKERGIDAAYTDAAEPPVPAPLPDTLPDYMPASDTGSAQGEAAPLQDAGEEPVLTDGEASASGSETEAAPAGEPTPSEALPEQVSVADGAEELTDTPTGTSGGEQPEVSSPETEDGQAEEMTAPPEVDVLIYLGGNFASELTAAQPDVYARLMLERSQAIVLTASGMKLRVTLTHEISGATQRYLSEETEDGWVLTARQEATVGSYLLHIEAAEAGETGSFRVSVQPAIDESVTETETEDTQAGQPADDASEQPGDATPEKSAETSEPSGEADETPAAPETNDEDEATVDIGIVIGVGDEAGEGEEEGDASPEASGEAVADDEDEAPSTDDAVHEGDALSEEGRVQDENTPSGEETDQEGEAQDATGEEPTEPTEALPEALIPEEPDPALFRPMDGGDAVLALGEQALSRGVPVMLASANSVGNGDLVTFTVTGLVASTYNFSLYSVPIGGSQSTLIGYQGGAASSFAAVMPPQDTDVYCVANCLTEGGWQTVVSGWVHVRLPASALAITVTSSATTVEAGEAVTFTVHTSGGGSVYFYHYVIIDGSNSQLYAASSGSNSFTYTTPNWNCDLICLAFAYDGTFVSAYSPWVRVTPSTSLAIQCWVDVSSVAAGTVLTIHTAKTAGLNQILFYRYMLYDGTEILTSVDSATANQNVVVPNVSGTVYAYVLAWDGQRWAPAMSSGFTVTPATPLAISVTPSALSVRAGESMWFTVTQLSGGSIIFYRYTISDGDGNVLGVYDTTGSFQVFTPTASVSHIICTVQAYDGGWVTATSAWVSVTSPTYRALVIGQTYPGTSLALSGPDNDAQGIAAMLGTMNATPYTISRRTNLTRSGILSAISTAFSGAQNGDVSLFYYAGHAVTNTGAMIGTDVATLTPAQLRQALDQIPGKKIVIFDACYSGAYIGRGVGDITVQSANASSDSLVTVVFPDEEEAAADTVDDAALAQQMASAFLSAFTGASSRGAARSRSADNLADEGYYVICSAHSTQESWESGGYGWFTQTLTLGSGYNEKTGAVTSLAADSNGDRFISLSEIFSYCQRNYDGYTLDAFGKTVYFNTQCYPAGSSQKLYGRN